MESSSTCAFTLSPTLVTAPATGGSGTIAVTTTAGCTWTSSSNASWITVSGSGTGSGSVTYTIDANAASFSRSTLISIGGVFVGVSQGPVTPPSNLRVVGGVE
jgi:hypothetical protein